MSGENLVKFLLGTLDRVRDRALGMLGSGSPRSLVHHVYAWSHHADLPLGSHPVGNTAGPCRLALARNVHHVYALLSACYML